MKNFTFILSLLLTVSFFSCDETKKVIDAAGSVQLAGYYDVTSVGDARVKDNNITITFDAINKKISGKGGCNSYFAEYTLDLYAISFSDIGATEMYCDENVMLLENSFIAALSNTGSYEIKEGILTLYSKADRSELLKAKKRKIDE